MRDKSEINLERVKKSAEEYYISGSYYCSEAVIKSIKEEFKIDITDDIISMASGFGAGIGGSGCFCGAISGGVMMLGLFFGRSLPGDKKVKKAMKLSAELQDYFKNKNNSSCCRVLTRGMRIGSKKNKIQCVSFTGDIAYKTAEIILRELSG